MSVSNSDAIKSLQYQISMLVNNISDRNKKIATEEARIARRTAHKNEAARRGESQIVKNIDREIDGYKKLIAGYRKDIASFQQQIDRKQGDIERMARH